MVQPSILVLVLFLEFSDFLYLSMTNKILACELSLFAILIHYQAACSSHIYQPNLGFSVILHKFGFKPNDTFTGPFQTLLLNHHNYSFSVYSRAPHFSLSIVLSCQSLIWCNLFFYIHKYIWSPILSIYWNINSSTYISHNVL